MNYLQLGQSLVTECGAGSASLTTMQSQTGEALRFVNWVNSAWNELQTFRDDWAWMRSNAETGGGVSFVPAAGAPWCAWGTSAGQLGIQSTAFGGKWVEGSFRNYVTTVGQTSEIFMDFLPSLDHWRDGYYYGAQRNVRTRPVVLAIAPDRSLLVGPPSDGSYTVYGDYFKSPSSMSADVDTPTGLPNHYHMLIVYRGMMYYGEYESAPEVFDRGSRLYEEMFRELDQNYGPNVKVGGALA